MVTTTKQLTTDEKMDKIMDQQERLLEQQEEIIELLLERGLNTGTGYGVERTFDFDE